MTRKFQFLALTLATLAVGLAGHARAAALAYASVELSSFAVSVSDPGYILTYGPAPRTTGASATWGAVTNSNMVSAAYNAESNVAQQTDEAGRLALSSSLPYLQKQADAFLKFLG